jgi:hypothetical protein
VIVAQGIFIGSVAIAIIRTKALANLPNSQTYVNVEMYSIGFTALYFWVIFAVTLTSIIGTSQTADAIPNILSRFREDLCREFPLRNIDLPQNINADERHRRGGVYSWQPEGALEDVIENAAAVVQWVRAPTVPQFERRSSTRVMHILLPLSIVSSGTIIGMILTSRVPPEGWSCRSDAEITIFLVWLVSYPLTLIPWGSHHRFRFWFTFFKDFLAMAATLGIVIATQIGIFNKCSCYTRGGQTGLALPQGWIVKMSLENGLNMLSPALTGTGVGLQLVFFPGIIIYRYYEAIRVFLQRDDGESNLQWFHNICSLTWWMRQKKKFTAWMMIEYRTRLGKSITTLKTFPMERMRL